MSGPPRTLATAGYVDVKALPRGPNGFPLCRWCGKETSSARRTFCGGDRATFGYRDGRIIREGHGCVHEHCLRSNAGYARKLVRARDGGVCALCGVDARATGWQADHIKPVVEGGGSCGLENLRTLCTACHHVETKALAVRRAAARKGKVEP